MIIGTNHRPIIRETTDGLWRRIRLLPFTVTIPPEERDRQLPDKLQAEREGILAWAIRGCLEWQRIGLGLPDDVRHATDQYREDMDLLGGFIADKCVVAAEASAPAGALYQVYLAWANQAGERPASQKYFGLALTERGFTPVRRGKDRERTWLGIGIAGQESVPF